MDTNKSKYDTNPLEEDIERKAEEAWGESGGTPTAKWVPEPTREINQTPDSSRQNVYSEAPTRTFDSPAPEAPYPSVFVPPTYAPPKQYQPRHNVYQAPPGAARPFHEPVPGIGLPEKWAVVSPYAPFYIGLILSLLELFLVPRKEVRVRFHASQAVALHIAILIVHTFFGVISTITDSSLGGTLFKVAAFLFLIISMIRVSRGEPHHIAPLDEASKWFNEHIEPRNQ